ncbi:MAG: hypothetical protein GQ468_02585 [Candidatus Scalindua sp.]|nr:hypothetical protein [Candidatus Scalindua sp.]
MKLSGWKRLWILLAGIYLAAVMLFTYAEWPTTTYIEKERLNEMVALIDKTEGRVPKYKFSEVVEELNRRGTKTEPEDEFDRQVLKEDWIGLAELFLLNHKDNVDISDVESKYKRELSKVHEQRKKILLMGVLFWFIPVIAIYGLGLSVRCVIKVL